MDPVGSSSSSSLSRLSQPAPSGPAISAQRHLPQGVDRGQLPLVSVFHEARQRNQPQNAEQPERRVEANLPTRFAVGGAMIGSGIGAGFGVAESIAGSRDNAIAIGIGSVVGALAALLGEHRVSDGVANVFDRLTTDRAEGAESANGAEATDSMAAGVTTFEDLTPNQKLAFIGQHLEARSPSEDEETLAKTEKAKEDVQSDISNLRTDEMRSNTLKFMEIFQDRPVHIRGNEKFFDRPRPSPEEMELLDFFHKEIEERPLLSTVNALSKSISDRSVMNEIGQALSAPTNEGALDQAIDSFVSDVQRYALGLTMSSDEFSDFEAAGEKMNVEYVKEVVVQMVNNNISAEVFYPSDDEADAGSMASGNENNV